MYVKQLAFQFHTCLAGPPPPPTIIITCLSHRKLTPSLPPPCMLPLPPPLYLGLSSIAQQKNKSPSRKLTIWAGSGRVTGPTPIMQVGQCAWPPGVQLPHSPPPLLHRRKQRCPPPKGAEKNNSAKESTEKANDSRCWTPSE